MTKKELGQTARDKMSANWQLPLIPTKLSSPKVSGHLVARNRLGNLAPVVMERALTWVHAPAGYGKTTLLSQWRETHLAEGAVVAWVSLSEEDNSAHRILSYVVAALSAARSSLCDGARSTLNSGPSVPTQLAEAVLISELEACEEEIVLILDDYHLITDPQVHKLMLHLLQNRPKNLHLVIATRSDLPLHLSRLKLENQLLKIDVSDLRLDFNELEDFITEVVELELPKNVVRMLYTISEGWIAGVQIAALSPRLKKEPQTYLKEFTSGSKDLRNYLHEVVMDLLPPELEQTLLRCSILDRFNAPLCEAVAGVSDGRALLEKLSSLNLFLFALDDQNNWFRFHRLFSDFLREHLRKLGHDEIVKLHRTACNWFAGQQLWAEAVSHALAIEDTDLAQKFIEHCARDMLGQSRGGRLLNWGRQLPENRLSKNIHLRFAMVQAKLLMMELPPIQGLLHDIESDFQRDDDADVEGRREYVQAQLKIASSLLAMLEDRLDEVRLSTGFLVEQHEKLQEFDSEVVFFILGYVYLHQMRFDQITEIQQQAARIKGKPHFGAAYRKSFEGLAWFWRGRLDKARFFLEESLNAAEAIAGRHSMTSVTAIASLAELCYEQNDLEQTEELLAAAMTAPLDACLLITAQSIYSTQARISNLKGAKTESWESLEELEKIALKRGWKRLEAHCYLERIQSDILQGDSVAATGELLRFEQYLKTIEVDLDLVAREFIQDDWLISKSRVEHLHQEGSAVLKPLAQRIQVLDHQGALHRSAKFRMLLALSQWGEGNFKAAKQTLMPALKLGETQGFCRTFIDEVQGGQLLLAQIASDLTVEESSLAPYLKCLIDAMTPPKASLGVPEREEPASNPKLSGLERLNISEVTGREREILGLIGNGLFNKEVATALGISEGTVKWHLKNLYSKLGVSSRTQALKKAQGLGLID
ncbi:LuxR C-terminal-related transcriptional regulator [uncultured Marinobacter sp.]|uniref:LuxR C-terminal-related transcriptional regulator n=1 Tax=uncultured Marinobacter sp. TaxID=187379 RepID=UPI0030DCED8F